MKSERSDLFVRPIPSSRDTDPQHWKFLIFYYNPDNPRLFVPRRWTGLPVTLNFARPGAWAIAAIMLVALIVLMPFDHNMPGLLKAIHRLVTTTP